MFFPLIKLIKMKEKMLNPGVGKGERKQALSLLQ